MSARGHAFPLGGRNVKGDGEGPEPNRRKATRKSSGAGSEFFVVTSGGSTRVVRRALSSKAAEKAARVAAGDAGNDGPLGGVRRGESNKKPLTGFSWSSQQNLRDTFGAIPWDDIPRLAMVTYTYPKDFPTDGKLVKGHMQAMWKRWDRHPLWGKMRGMWVLEFQLRGAAHIHTLVGLPAQAEIEWDQGMNSDHWAWASRVWSEIVGTEPGSAHRHRGVNVRKAFYGGYRLDAGAVGRYFADESAKWAQKQVPKEYENVGRVWGYRGVKPVRHWLPVPKATAMKARRALIALRDRDAGRKTTRPRGLDGVRYANDNGNALGVRLVRWAEE